MAPAAVALGRPASAFRPRSSWPGRRPRSAGSSSITSPARTGATTPSATGSASPRATTPSAGGSTTGSARSSACVEQDPPAGRDRRRRPARGLHRGRRGAARGDGSRRAIAERHPIGSPQRRWAERELRVLLGEYRDAARPPRAAGPTRGERRAAPQLPRVARARAELHRLPRRDRGASARRQRGRAAELVERVMAAPVPEPGRWFSLVQLLTEAGQLDRASVLLAEIARGEHPEALDPRRVHGPWRRIAAARERLARARRRGLAATRLSDGAHRSSAGAAARCDRRGGRRAPRRVAGRAGRSTCRTPSSSSWPSRIVGLRSRGIGRARRVRRRRNHGVRDRSRPARWRSDPGSRATSCASSPSCSARRRSSTS